MSKPIVKSPFSDAVGAKTIPQKGSAGVYDSQQNLPAGLPSADKSSDCPPLKYYDKAGTSKSPSTSGPIKNSPFDGAIS